MAKIDIELQPFRTPNFVLAVTKPGQRQDGLKEVPSFPLRDLDAETLEQLCADFRKEVFEKAEKPLRKCINCKQLESLNNSGYCSKCHTLG